MVGMKGRSGGARANSGGACPGAGAPKRPVPKLDTVAVTDPKVFLMAVMNDAGTDARLRIDAAKALLPFVHHKLDAGGKKELVLIAAKKAATGRFAPSAPPKLKLIP